jgi:hypothetical protein
MMRSPRDPARRRPGGGRTAMLPVAGARRYVINMIKQQINMIT